MPACCSCAGTRPDDAAGARRPPLTPWVRLGGLAILAAQSMIVSLAINLTPPEGRTRLILHALLAGSALAAFALAGGPLVRAAVAAVQSRRLVFEQLFLLGIAAAFAASTTASLTGTGHVYYEVVAILLAIHALGDALGQRQRADALGAARALGSEFATANLVHADGRITSVPTARIRAGDLVQIPAGGSVPVDGIVVAGTALADESTLSGEPFPVARHPGDPIRAGSRLADGPLRVRATTDGGSRSLDALLARVHAAQGRASRLQRQADSIVAWFLPLVTVVAIGTIAFWVPRAGWTTGLFNALSVLLVACPCAMGLATPIGIWSTMGNLARLGLIAHDSDIVERLALVTRVAFDKTGTLGDDQPEIVDFVAAPGVSHEPLLAEIAALEAASPHPFSRAFRGIPASEIARDVTALPGMGIEGHVGPARLQIGNASLLAGLRDPLPSLKTACGPDAATHEIFVVRDGTLAARCLLRERLRPTSRETLARLEALGLPCVVLTGDRPEAAAVHHLAPLEAGLSPLDKATRVRELSRRSRVLFVGDGTNDAPAMAEAFVALAVAAGSDVARETAHGELRDPGSLPEAILACRKAVRCIRQNLLFAAVYNALGITLAATGLLHPVAAALLMFASSLTVSTRALRRMAPAPQPAAVSPL